PIFPVNITNAEIINDNQAGVLRLNSAEGFTGSATITVTATNGQQGAGSTAQRTFMVSASPDTVNDRAFLGAVSDQVTQLNTPTTFTVQGFDLEDDNLTFIARQPGNINANPANVTVDIQV